MKLTCTQSDLNSALSLVSRAVASRPSHPVLANVLLVADEDTQQVALTAFDLSLGIQTSFTATVDLGAKLTLPSRLLTEIISRLPDGELTLEADLDDGFLCAIASASGTYEVRGMGADEFPSLPDIDDGETLELPSKLLLDGIRNTCFAASGDETKQVLTGVRLTLAKDSLEFASSDGHRLAVVELEGGDRAETLGITIPAKALQELTKMIEKVDGTVALKCDRSQVVFSLRDHRLTSRLLEGQFPDYRRLIPKTFERVMTCDRRSLVSSLERIAVFADQKNNIVKLVMSAADQELTLSVDAADVGSGRESLPCVFTGEDLAIAFNVRYLLDGLKVMSSSEVQMQFNTPTSPAVLTPMGELKMTYLAMPCQTRS